MNPVVTAAIAAGYKHMQNRKQDRAQTGSNTAPSSLSNVVGDVAVAAINEKSKSLADKGLSAGDTKPTESAGIGTDTSDQRLKDIFGEKAPVEDFAKINAYLFKYKPEAQEKYAGTRGVDDKEHVGVMAQELAENPVTAAAVDTDEMGYLEIDTGKLCTALAAVCSDLSKRVLELEEAIAELKETREGK